RLSHPILLKGEVELQASDFQRLPVVRPSRRMAEGAEEPNLVSRIVLRRYHFHFLAYPMDYREAIEQQLLNLPLLFDFETVPVEREQKDRPEGQSQTPRDHFTVDLDLHGVVLRFHRRCHFDSDPVGLFQGISREARVAEQDRSVRLQVTDL